MSVPPASFVEDVNLATPVLGTDLELRVGVDPRDAPALATIAATVLAETLREIEATVPADEKSARV